MTNKTLKSNQVNIVTFSPFKKFLNMSSLIANKVKRLISGFYGPYICANMCLTSAKLLACATAQKLTA